MSSMYAQDVIEKNSFELPPKFFIAVDNCFFTNGPILLAGSIQAQDQPACGLSICRVTYLHYGVKCVQQSKVYKYTSSTLSRLNNEVPICTFTVPHRDPQGLYRYWFQGT